MYRFYMVLHSHGSSSYFTVIPGNQDVWVWPLKNRSDQVIGHDGYRLYMIAVNVVDKEE